MLAGSLIAAKSPETMSDFFTNKLGFLRL